MRQISAYSLTYSGPDFDVDSLLHTI